MSLNRIQLSAENILEKDFKTTMRGYNQEEVDEFLDIVIQDYEAFNQEIEKLKLENDRLKKNGPSEEAAQPKKRSEIHSGNQANTQVNYDVLKRLSNLEKAVFGKKISEVE
ncbi:MAG TPA: cell division regulator GpsB [Candidatus Avamphibacillus intestinigallinarum]|nr:cell division regulator GpsB [Candidatus Avamphibacillus intestinigallinarum]